MEDPVKKNARRFMQLELARDPADYLDCGEVNRTLLAERCADELDLTRPPEHAIPDWAFDLAHDVASHHEQRVARLESDELLESQP
jgi:hypothetical protein